MNCSTPGLPVHLTVAILIVNNLFCVFDLLFPSDEHFLTCLLAICMSSLEKCLFRYFAYFFSFIEVWLIYSVLTSVQNDSVIHIYIFFLIFFPLWLITALPIFKLGYLRLLLLSCRSSLHILDINPSSVLFCEQLVY